MATTRTEFTFKVEDRPGTLASIAEGLANAGINLESCIGYRSDGKGIIQIIPSDPAAAVKALKEEGIKYDTHEVFEISLQNKPGQLASLAHALGEAGVNIKSFYITMQQSQIMSVDNVVNATKIFTKYGL